MTEIGDDYRDSGSVTCAFISMKIDLSIRCLSEYYNIFICNVDDYVGFSKNKFC